jgi:hypothetical protein
MKINPDLKKNIKPANDEYPETIWKLSTVAWISFLIILSVSLTIMLISKKSIYDEIEYIIVAVAIILFNFLVNGLYTGAKVRHKPIAPKFTLFKKTLNISFDSFEMLDVFGEIPFLAWIPATIFVIVFTFFSIVALGSILVGLIFIFSWIVYRAVRLVLIKGLLCKGDLRKSILVAAQYTLLYTGWILGIVWVLEHKPWKYFIS